MTKKNLTKTNTNEEVIKKSLFIGVCFPIKSSLDFFETLERLQDLNATHNCWAYRVGNEYRFNDDGEPSGTAGKPILAAIDGAGFDSVGALVIRHYGGIKLGTGGLARAYGGTIATNLNQAQYEFHVSKSKLNVTVEFKYNQSVFQLLKQFEGELLDQKFIAQGVDISLKLPEKNRKKFSEHLNNQTKGSVIIEDLTG